MSEAQQAAEAAPARTLTVHQINGRLAELSRQRDAAQAQCAILAGDYAEAADLIRSLRAEIEHLQGLLSAQAGSSAAH